MRVERENRLTAEVIDVPSGACVEWNGDACIVLSSDGSNRPIADLDTGKIYNLMKCDRVTLLNAKVVIE